MIVDYHLPFLKKVWAPKLLDRGLSLVVRALGISSPIEHIMGYNVNEGRCLASKVNRHEGIGLGESSMLRDPLHGIDKSLNPSSKEMLVASSCCQT